MSMYQSEGCAKEVHLVRVLTVPYQVKVFLLEQLIYLKKNGFRITVISGPDQNIEQFLKSNGIEYHVILFARNPSLITDLKALHKLSWILFRLKPDIVHSMSSKAGFLSCVASKLVGVPITIHTFAGNPWLGRKGLARWIAVLADKIICYLNDVCLADSHSQVKLLENYNICREGYVKVIANGSVCGVNLSRFKRKYFPEVLKGDFKIPAVSIVLIFVGRITREKGVKDLAYIVKSLNQRGFKYNLIILGDEDKEHDPPAENDVKYLKNQTNVHFIGFVSDPEKYLQISDLLLIPSYREGFCNAVIEAGAMGVPAVGYRISGLIDSIIDGVTGVLAEERDMCELSLKISQLIEKPHLIKQLGEAARIRVQQEFSADIINQETMLFYKHYIQKNNIGRGKR